MMNNYFVQVIVFQLIFICIYDLFLKKETFFNLNRAYLLLTFILSFVLPKIKIPFFKEQIETYRMLEVIEISTINKVLEKQSLDYLNLIFWIGFSLFFALFSIKLYKLVQLIIKTESLKFETYQLLILENSKSAFSFFSYVFMGENIVSDRKKQIMEHELVHVKERHSIDLVSFEFMKILIWFNPLTYLYQKRMETIHEYIADKKTAKHSHKSYVKNLLAETFDINNFSFVNQFYKQSLIKKRIIMLTKSKSNSKKLNKYALLIPVLFGMLIYSSCQKKAKEVEIKKEVIESVSETVSFSNLDKNVNFKHSTTDNFQKDLASFIGENFETSIIKQIPDLKEKVELEKKKRESRITPEDKIEIQNLLKKTNKNIKSKNPSADMVRIMIAFVVNDKGLIENVKVKAPDPKLEEEAKRLINSLPQLIPGEVNGSVVKTKYALPIALKI